MNYTKLLCGIAFIVTLALAGKTSFTRDEIPSQNSIRFQRATRLNAEAIPLLKSIHLSVGKQEIIANIHRGENYELIRFWTPEHNDYRLLHTMQSDPNEGFEDPSAFQFQREHFVRICTTPTGSSGFVNETVLWVAPDKTLHPVEFVPASQEYEANVSEHELVLSGGPGMIIGRGKLRFEFYIAKDADPHCCPTAGKVTGLYQLQGGSHFDANTRQFGCTYKILPQDFRRTKIPASDLAKFNPPSE